MAVVVAACTLVAFLKVTLEDDSFYQTLKRILGKVIFKPSNFYRNDIEFLRFF